MQEAVSQEDRYTTGTSHAIRAGCGDLEVYRPDAGTTPATGQEGGDEGGVEPGQGGGLGQVQGTHREVQ